ncbi:MAG TPA: hypothetical protein VKY65_17965 [Alphaproteobacteria bacterium]|nr:hypothetical protein [Alphaproteobacteria bacterium]
MKLRAPQGVTHLFFRGAHHEIGADGLIEVPEAAAAILRAHGFRRPDEPRDGEEPSAGVTIESKGFGRFIVKGPGGQALHKGYLAKAEAQELAAHHRSKSNDTEVGR